MTSFKATTYIDYLLEELPKLENDAVLELRCLVDYLGYPEAKQYLVKKEMEAIGILPTAMNHPSGKFKKWGITKENFVNIIENALIKPKKSQSGYKSAAQLIEEHALNEDQKIKYSKLYKQPSAKIISFEILKSFMLNRDSKLSSSEVLGGMTSKSDLKNTITPFEKCDYYDARVIYEYLEITVEKINPGTVFRGGDAKGISQFRFIIARFNNKFLGESIHKYLDHLIIHWEDLVNHLHKKHNIILVMWFPTAGVLLKYSEEIMSWYAGVNHE